MPGSCCSSSCNDAVLSELSLRLAFLFQAGCRYWNHIANFVPYSYTNAIHRLLHPSSPQTVTFFSKNSVHSRSPQELEISFAMRPSQSTVGETWMPFCLEYLTVRRARQHLHSSPTRGKTYRCT